jgi:HK97 gp10 family phage protein
VARHNVTGNRREVIVIEGLDELLRDVAELPRRARGPFRKQMRAASALVRDEAKRLIKSGIRTGKRYPKPNGRTEYTASAPGEPPAKVEADLVNSIKIEVGRSGLSARVYTADPKGHLMEYGTVKIAPRPFLRPALAAMKGQVLKLLERGYRAGVALVFGKGSR